jgi:hypothetical protein
LPNIVVGILHGVIRWLARPVVSKAGGFNAAIVVASRAAPACCMSDVFGKTIAVNSQQPAGRVVEMTARLCTISEDFTMQLAAGKDIFYSTINCILLDFTHPRKSSFFLSTYL